MTEMKTRWVLLLMVVVIVVIGSCAQQQASRIPCDDYVQKGMEIVAVGTQRQYRVVNDIYKVTFGNQSGLIEVKRIGKAPLSQNFNIPKEGNMQVILISSMDLNGATLSTFGPLFVLSCQGKILVLDQDATKPKLQT